jgi:CHAT domain-containing protein
MSLWEIPAEQTLLQLQHLSMALREDPASKARALQRAQIEMIADRPGQPNLWAGLILFGEP